MDLQYASDLHLEFEENEDFLRDEFLHAKGDILILAGDIVPLGKLDRYEWFFDEVSKRFKTTYWIPGNHEYYHFDLAAREGAFEVPIRHNVWLVNDFATTIDRTRLIFSTLWTDISPLNAMAIQRGLNDFHLIKYHGRRLTADDMREVHQRSRAFIEQELAARRSEVKTIVVTHHVPTFMNYPPEYLGDSLNEAFAVELEQLIIKEQPDYWIYGHHHQHIPQFSIGETKLVTNQLGYVRNGEHHLFNRSKLLGPDQVNPDDDLLPGLKTDDDTHRRWRRGPKR